MRLRVFVAIFFSLTFSAVAIAQLRQGNVYGRVTDAQAEAVPGVTVTLSGIGAPQTFVTENDGQFRFLNLDPGRYTLTAELSGFATVSRPVEVSVGRNIEVPLTVSPAVQETITVSAATPIIDTRRTGTGQNVSEIELKEVPSARDQWTVLQTIPGVVVDTVAVGGNTSGQQAYFVSKGAERHQTEWNLDGVTTTDMDTTGGVSMYLDFESFEEVQVTTASSDPAKKTPGVLFNAVTKRGENELKGSARWYWTDQQFQGDPEVPAEAVDYLTVPNSVDHIDEYGFEAGGPLIRDRLWAWGSFGFNDIRNFLEGGIKKTELENYNAKLHTQLLPQNTATLQYVRSDKRVAGRGLSLTRPAETAHDQVTPVTVWKVEDTHQFSQNFYLTGYASQTESYYALEPRGGRDVEVYWDVDGVAHNSYRFQENEQPQEQYRVDGSTFFDAGPTNHELKFGIGYRDVFSDWNLGWPGNRTFADLENEEAAITRDAPSRYGSDYLDLYLGDTIQMGNLTVTAGLRYDMQKAQNFAADAPANPLFPQVLSNASFPGDDRELEWKSITPRLGLTYALGQNNRTVVRAAYNQYVDQMGNSDAGIAHPFYSWQGIYYDWTDLNGNNRLDPNEIDLDEPTFFRRVDPNDPNGGFSTVRLDYDMEAPSTDEYLAGIEHELVPGFAIGALYAYRRLDNILWTQYEKTRGSGDFYTSADYVLLPTPIRITLPDGTIVEEPNYRLRAGLPAPVYQVYRNRPDYRRTYEGVELTAIKRMANRWMMRANVNLGEWKQEVGPNGYADPTRVLSGDSCVPCDDAYVGSSGGAGSTLQNARWSYSVTGLYELPYQITLGAAVNGREGFILPVFRRVNNRDLIGNKSVLIGDLGDNRLPDVLNVDLKIAKDFAITNGTNLEIGIDLFNVTDQRTILDRDPRLYQTTWTGSDNFWIQELQSPRIWRFSARFEF